MLGTRYQTVKRRQIILPSGGEVQRSRVRESSNEDVEILLSAEPENSTTERATYW